MQKYKTNHSVSYEMSLQSEIHLAIPLLASAVEVEFYKVLAQVFIYVI